MLSAIEDWRGNAKSRSCKASGVVDYVDGFIYIDGVFQSFAHSQGRVNVGDIGTFNEYFISDHLGNTRVIYADLDASGTIDVNENICEMLEEYHYYHVAAPEDEGRRLARIDPAAQRGPFGEEMTGLWTPDEEHLGHSKYRYNGKEKQTELDALSDEAIAKSEGWYNYGARYYDPQIARFTGVDPIADQFPHLSTYNYASNDPITNVDLHGLQGVPFSLIAGLTAKVAKAFQSGSGAQGKGSMSILLIGSSSGRQESMSTLQSASNFATGVRNNAFDVAEKGAQNVQTGADVVESGALALTAMSGGATGPVTVPVATIAASVGTAALGVEVAIDVARDGELDATGTQIMAKAVSSGLGKVMGIGVDGLQIGGQHAKQSTNAVKAAGDGVLKVVEEAINTKKRTDKT